MPEASFAIYLLVLLLAGIVLSTWQARRYGRQVRDLVRAHRGEDLHLVSGCGKGVARGAVVLLLVDPAHETIVEARATTGASVFARIRHAPNLVGPITGAASRAGNPRLAKAVTQAIEMLPTLTRHEPAKRVIRRSVMTSA